MSADNCELEINTSAITGVKKLWRMQPGEKEGGFAFVTPSPFHPGYSSLHCTNTGY